MKALDRSEVCVAVVALVVAVLPVAGLAGPLFTVQAYSIVGGGGSTDNDLNDTAESLALWDAIDGGAGTGAVTIGATTYNIQNLVTDTEAVVTYNRGTFNPPYPSVAYSTISGDGPGGGGGPITGGEDFSVRALATVTFQPGTYSIGAGSDDGRYLRLDGITFTGFGGQGGTYQAAADTIRFDAPTGHNYSVGTFTVAAPTTATLDAHFWERGGGDSFDLVIRSGADTSMGGPGEGWELLRDGALGGTVSVDDAYALASRDAPVARLTGTAGPDIRGSAYVDDDGLPIPSTGWMLERREDGLVVGGLLGEYYTRNGDNPGTFIGSRIDLGAGGPSEFYFGDNFAYGPWGTVEEDFFARWTGNIDIPQDGTYNFRMNTDDRSRIFLDIDGDGLLEAAPGQPAWTVNWTGVNLTAGLHAVEFNAIEYGGGEWTRLEWELPGVFGWQTIPASYFSTLYPWILLAAGSTAVGDPAGDGLFGLSLPPGTYDLRLTEYNYRQSAVAEGTFVVPEPATLALLGLAACGLRGYTRRRRRA